MKTAEQTQNSLSNFKQYLDVWDLNIESLDDFEEKEKMNKILVETVNFLLGQTVDWETKSVEKDPTGEDLLKLIENPKYKEFKRIYGNLLWLKSRVNDLFEIKHRRTKENFDLKSEVALLKLKTKNYE